MSLDSNGNGDSVIVSLGISFVFGAIVFFGARLLFWPDYWGAYSVSSNIGWMSTFMFALAYTLPVLVVLSKNTNVTYFKQALRSEESSEPRGKLLGFGGTIAFTILLIPMSTFLVLAFSRQGIVVDDASNKLYYFPLLGKSVEYDANDVKDISPCASAYGKRKRKKDGRLLVMRRADATVPLQDECYLFTPRQIEELFARTSKIRDADK